MKTELEILEERVRELKRAQTLCNHEWDEVKFEPERKEITRKEWVYLGSDSYCTDVGTGLFKNVNRWSRTCKKCGKKEYSYKQEEVAIQTIKRPKF